MNIGNHSHNSNENLVLFYADDDREDQDFFQEALASLNASNPLYTHDSGEELLRSLKQTQLNSLVFLDLNMPGMNGLEVLNEMNNNNIIKETPVVVFSTSNDSKTIEDCKGLGASLFITKPNSLEGLKKSILHVLSLNWHPPKLEDTPFHLSF